jgi:5-methylcytosine-specific restriction endonuclease McrA
MGIENKLLVLKLNKNWQVIDHELVGKAICDLAAGINSFALDIDYGIDEQTGEVDFRNPVVTRPVSWEEWITLPVREWDFSIKTVNRVIRVPTVLIARNCDKVPEVRFGKTPSVEQIRMRDGDTCQYTGKRLRREDISIDHVVPRSRGGDNGWTNLVVTHKEINSRKGNQLNNEVGLKLIRPPKPLASMPRWKLIRKAQHADWGIFLKLDQPDNVTGN